MAEKREIELIPEEATEEKKKRGLLRSIRLVGFGFLAVTILLLILLLSAIAAQTASLNDLQKQVSDKEGRIKELAEIEEEVVGVTAKSDTLTYVFADRDYYSLLLEALSKSIPAGVEVTALTAGVEEGVGISGEVQNYTALASFLRNLVDPEKGGNLFTEVSLSSVSFDPTQGVSQFTAEAMITKNGLKNGWESLLEEDWEAVLEESWESVSGGEGE